MHREGIDPAAVRMEDVLCDFCHRPWTEDVPMVEGHHGSCICGDCLRTAWHAIIPAPEGTAQDDTPVHCTMCLEERTDRAFRPSAFPGAAICLRCTRLAARALARDAGSGWQHPESAATAPGTAPHDSTQD